MPIPQRDCTCRHPSIDKATRTATESALHSLCLIARLPHVAAEPAALTHQLGESPSETLTALIKTFDQMRDSDYGSNIEDETLRAMDECTRDAINGNAAVSAPSQVANDVRFAASTSVWRLAA